MKGKHSATVTIGLIGGILVMAILVLGTLWMGQSARKDTGEAVRSVSLLYLDELAGRREQVVEANLQEKIGVIRTAIELMTEADLSDKAHMEAYQAHMKQLYRLDKFAFVDADGLIYTSVGTQDNIGDYAFDYRSLKEPEISLLNPESTERKVVIAVPVKLTFQGKTLTVCFMEISMQEMLAGVSLEAQEGSATFCNLYTSGGMALSNTVLGGLAQEDNLLEAMKIAEFEDGYTYERFRGEFENGHSGVVSFSYKGIRESLSYRAIDGTDWLLTYLIRESVISERISSVSSGIISRSVIQSAATVVVLLTMFLFILYQIRKNMRLTLEKETADAENRARQEEMEQRLALHEEVVEKSRQLQEALSAAESANRAKTAFLSNMSHEIRTPMNAIIGLDSIALNDPTISPTTRDYLEKIGSSAHHLLSLINDILDMSRIESGRMTIRNEEFSFSDLISHVNTMIGGQCQDKKLRYSCQIRGQVDDAYIGDGVKLRQVLINMLGNAVKFTPEGGEVTFLIEEAVRLEDKTTLRFVIRDTGIGMSEEFLPHLFDTFAQEDSSSTSRYGSTGLGMAITKSIIELMNGQIAVQSKKGRGTTFTVTLTLKRAGAQPSQDEIELRPGEMHVLVVDDDPVDCEHAKVVLGQVGVHCETAASGAESIGMIQVRHARREDYDLVLVDWRMPGMDGVETARKIREIVGQEMPIIILTAYSWEEIEQEAGEAGVDSFVSKPLFAGNVMDRFRDCFRRKHQSLLERTCDLKGRRVLLAEDVSVNAEILMMVLSMREMEAELAENGRIAVEKFAAHEPGYYDAILMDMRMPEMDGLEATRIIRAMDREDARTIPMIALTANAFDEDVQRSMQAGLNAHLSKPVDPELLFSTLEHLIRP